ncbi:MAG: hypothetical protein Fur0022_07880 [Anaerolineales bacterium]
MESCTFHPDHVAIEHCEICHRPLCDLCLWYADDGRRMCATHARAHKTTGGEVHPPETYDEALQPRELNDPLLPVPPDRAPYRGNSTDVYAALAVVMGATSLASCMGFAYCLPIVSGIVGLVAMMNAKNALNPQRTRTFGAIGLGIGLLGLLPLVMITGYFLVMMIFFAYSSATGNFGP